MTRLEIDLSDALDEFHPDDKVVVWSPVHREGSRGQTISTRQHRMPLEGGQATEDVEPGPLMVQIQCQGIADTAAKEVVVPDQASVTLWDLLEQKFTYTPPIISEVSEARVEVREAVARVGSAEQVGEWAERSETAASDALVIKNSIPATVQSEVDTRVPPAVTDAIAQDSTIVTAAQDAVYAEVDAGLPGKADTTYVDAELAGKADKGHKHGAGDISEKTVNVGNSADAYKLLYLDVNGKLRVNTSTVTAERDVASKGYVDSKAWGQGLVPTSVTSLDQLIDGLHSVANEGVAGDLGIPGRVTGNLQIQTIANGRTAWYLSGGSDPALYINALSAGVWSGWQEVSGGGSTGSGDSWHKSLIPTSVTSLDDLVDGMWGIGNGGVSRTLGIPGAPYGNLQIQTISSGRTAFVLTQDTVPSVYVTAKAGGVWAEWQKIFPTDIPPSTRYAAGGLKTVPLALSTGISGDGVTSGRWRTLAHFGAPITRWRLHISNVSPVWGTSRGGFTLGEVTVGAHTGDGQMTTTRVLNEAPVQVADGEDWVSEWVTGVDLEQEHLIDWTFDGATSTYLALTAGWDMATGTPVQTTRAALWTWLEAETYEQTPTVALIGDSTGAGVGADRPVYESALAIVGRKQGFLPVLYAHSGDTLEGNPGIEDFNFQRWRDFPAPDSIIIQAGSNDLHASGADLAEMQRRYAATAEAAHQIAPVVIGATVKPRYPNHPDYDGNRVQFNDWLQTLPEGIRDVLQFDEVLAPDGSLPAEYNADGSHINTIGYEIMATAFEGIPISRPPAAPQKTNSGEIDTGWRSIDLLTGEGQVLLRRVGKHVTVSIQDWKSEGEYAVHIALLPTGFRPTGKKFFMAASHTWAFKPSIIGMYSGAHVSWLRSVDGGFARPTAPQSGEITFLTDDPEPTIYPGTPG